MDNFVFRGRDIAEFGAVAAFGESMRTGAKIQRSEYEMPGGGSVEIGRPTYKPTTRLVTITPADGMRATPAWRRDILAWLQEGRGVLTVHNDPSVYRIAQFDTDGSYDWRTWPLGMIQLTMTLQPYACAQSMTTVSAQTASGKAQLQLVMETGIDTPLEIEATAQGGTMTAIEIAAGAQSVTLEGLRIPAGGKLVYCAGDNMEDLAAVYENGALTFSHVTRWAQLQAAGRTPVSVSVTGCEAQIRARARCRYPA